RELVWVNRSGQAELVDPDLGPALYQTLSLSPDDSRVALTIVGTDVSGAPAPELWVKELPNGP
ncbi:MAG: hypothetical protein GWN32_00220, partial [Gemmatimonadetes bacterium]|nr:hypothetical protein [Gemmatimonadota bacterium]